MPPLTSPSECDSCLGLTQKVSELEGRISILYQIKEEERILDSLFTVGPAVTTTGARDLDSTDSLITSGPAVTTTAAGELDSTVSCLAVAATQAADLWTQLGAKPKASVSSTPAHKEPWTAARRGKHGAKSLSRPHPPLALQLANKNTFSILDKLNFPPLARRRIPSSSLELDSFLSPPPLPTALSKSPPNQKGHAPSDTLPPHNLTASSPPLVLKSPLQFRPPSSLLLQLLPLLLRVLVRLAPLLQQMSHCHLLALLRVVPPCGERVFAAALRWYLAPPAGAFPLLPLPGLWGNLDEMSFLLATPAPLLL
ncbi:hypothetical protein SKAU_G00282330 [Synaphobranchus kaupii]|uniref:Uncharacterized protein n=1 Tax=Synaphobranchus kaupii TaxID=118154 RepID=A0A9Q1EXB7_SYNKA|nr:hypothetical protein SKAU_G00282330 [Synaphobranchus kaupii]